MELPWRLTEHEARVLGALMEKQVTTPEYYPMSLNALMNACNQKSNRDPVMTLGEDDVRLAARNLHEKGLVGTRPEGRVVKFEHHMQEALNLTRGQAAVVCMLLLRGPQTPGELRGRCERMYDFTELDEVMRVLHQLLEHDPPLAAMLARQPGTKESRYAHLLCGAVAAESAPQWEPAAGAARSLSERVAELEARIEALERKFPV
ncbi:MAG TPA: YceH family protein [Terriglobales bacterium]|nr:YceH family protein [Terriglobales bacterium]